MGIAGVLATSKMFPFAKGMEFVGLGTWFAAMALWPRVLGVPIQMKTGVNINQRYIDSAQNGLRRQPVSTHGSFQAC